eukprot:6141340-Prymnesium_polylepis.1
MAGVARHKLRRIACRAGLRGATQTVTPSSIVASTVYFLCFLLLGGCGAAAATRFMAARLSTGFGQRRSMHGCFLMFGPPNLGLLSRRFARGMHSQPRDGLGHTSVLCRTAGANVQAALTRGSGRTCRSRSSCTRSSCCSGPSW